MSKTTLTHRPSSNLFLGVANAIRGLINGIKNLVLSVIKGIFNLISAIVRGIVNLISAIIKGIYNILKAIGNGIKAFFSWLSHTLWLVFVRPFLPSYKIIFSLYTVIPGMPVRKNDSIHAFEKGSSKKALKFYDDVINSAVERRIVPAEVRLIKRKKLIAKRNFGPVDELKKFRIVRTKIKV